MFGENAKEVKMDLTGIEDRECSFEIGHEWSIAMKAAIRKDVELLCCSKEQKTVEVDLRYEIACERVIVDLLFEVKWLKRALKSLQDANKG